MKGQEQAGIKRGARSTANAENSRLAGQWGWKALASSTDVPHHPWGLWEAGVEPARPGASLTALADVHAEEWQLGAVGADAVEVLTVELSLPLLLPQLHPADVTAAVEEVLLQPPVGEKRGKGTSEPREAPLPPRALKPKAPHLLLRLMREGIWQRL